MTARNINHGIIGWLETTFGSHTSSMKLTIQVKIVVPIMSPIACDWQQEHLPPLLQKPQEIAGCPQK